MQSFGPYLGLTGGIATGKTTVAQMFCALGAHVIDADRIGHELIRPSLPAYQEIVERFGSQVLEASGEVDRKRLGAIVFADREKLQELNAILHPRIIARVEDLARQILSETPRAVILVDAALLFEAGIGGRCAKVIVTWCRTEQQIERLMAKAGISRQEAVQRVTSQMPAVEKRRRADYVIDCSQDLAKTRRQVEELYPRLKQLVEASANRESGPGG